MTEPEDLRKVAEGLAGPHETQVGWRLCGAQYIGKNESHCDCAKRQRVTAILARLQADREEKERLKALLAVTLRPKLEAAEAKVEELESQLTTTLAIWDAHAESMERQACDWLSGACADTPENRERHRDCIVEIVAGVRESAAKLRAQVASLEKERDTLKQVTCKSCGEWQEAVAQARAEGKREGIEAAAKTADFHGDVYVAERIRALLTESAGEGKGER